jgi:Delta24-sterol reductase
MKINETIILTTLFILVILPKSNIIRSSYKYKRNTKRSKNALLLPIKKIQEGVGITDIKSKKISKLDKFEHNYKLRITTQEKLEYLLEITSRTFSLSILEIKDNYIRKKMTLSYLICRSLDTIEDDTSKTVEQRTYGINKFIEIFLKENIPISFLLNYGLDNEIEYKFLLSKFSLLKDEYNSSDVESKNVIKKCVVEMGNGMIKYLENSITTHEEYEEYCYYAAGTVAVLLNDLHYIRFRKKEEIYTKDFANSLQKTNIILDISNDSCQGRWFLPIERSKITQDDINFYIYDALKSIYETTNSILNINYLWNSHKIATTSISLALHSLSLAYNNDKLLYKRVKVKKEILNKCITEDIDEFRQLLYDAIHILYKKNKTILNVKLKKDMDLLIKNIINKTVDDSIVDFYKFNETSYSKKKTILNYIRTRRRRLKYEIAPIIKSSVGKSIRKITKEKKQKQDYIKKMNRIINNIIKIRNDNNSMDMYTLELKKIFTYENKRFNKIILLKYEYEYKNTIQNLIKLLEYSLQWILYLEKSYVNIELSPEIDNNYYQYIEIVKSIYTHKHNLKHMKLTQISLDDYNNKVDIVKTQILTAYNNQIKVVTSRSEKERFITRSAKYLMKYPKIRLNGKSIIEFNKTEKTIRVEPRINIGEITTFLYKYNLSIGVVPELKCLTAGGLICGCGAESTSWKYGVFFERVRCYDIVFGNGEHKTITKDDPFFRYLSYSYGTLGLVTSITFDCIEIKPYVKIELIQTNLLECENIIRKIIDENKYEYIDGLLFSKDKIILMLGTNVSEKGDNYLENEYLENQLFYKYIKYTKNKEFYMNYIDYCFRYDMGGFWLNDALLPTESSIYRRIIQEIVGNHPTFYSAIPRDIILKHITLNNLVIQDCTVPFMNIKNFINTLYDYCEIKRYPLWICPIKLNPYPLLNIRSNVQLYINIGFYTKIKKIKNSSFLKKMEKATYKNLGFTINYTEMASSKDEYYSNQINYKEYMKIRKLYNADKTFPEIYDKLS